MRRWAARDVHSQTLNNPNTERIGSGHDASRRARLGNMLLEDNDRQHCYLTRKLDTAH
jgi:hypothetical protein